MAEEFEGRDLSDAVFWGVDLSRARFRDVDMTDVTISHARLVNVDIDGLVDRITINGVDVTPYINERDRWYPLRAMIRPADPCSITCFAKLCDRKKSPRRSMLMCLSQLSGVTSSTASRVE